MKADLVVKNGWVVTPDETFKGGVAISGEKFIAIGNKPRKKALQITPNFRVGILLDQKRRGRVLDM